MKSGCMSRVNSGVRNNWLFFLNHTATTEIYTLSLHDALPISPRLPLRGPADRRASGPPGHAAPAVGVDRGGALRLDRLGRRSEEHTSELQSRPYLVCRLLLAKKTTTYQRLSIFNS